ncbi:hypothetical protein ASE98_21860 [Pseudomonas sp. Leaf48]|jgi:hypothetical protein|uniref:hypothetical protein n=1 Tax=Pseudomonas sp. Leaf48 TaxID=1736221 RepID=UPI0007291199|nr:hypothetical protein [Pseudomonas sp. Leaf48]KQN52529.1 hypothetical protein ASE98_21860 [Pseudomonas sp. Leaf48]
MSKLENFVAFDWRSGKDKIYFFFKDTNTYTRFDIAQGWAAMGFPKAINHSTWHDFHVNAKNLRFGFTTKLDILLTPYITKSRDILWLFYYQGTTPRVCEYDQETDKVWSDRKLADTHWHPILPYFDHIIAGTWWDITVEWIGEPNPIRFLMDNGYSLSLQRGNLTVETINEMTWRGLEPYKHRMITAAQNDRTLASSHFYIFLTNDEYLVYNMPENRVMGCYPVNDETWPGLLRD